MHLFLDGGHGGQGDGAWDEEVGKMQYYVLKWLSKVMVMRDEGGQGDGGEDEGWQYKQGMNDALVMVDSKVMGWT